VNNYGKDIAKGLTILGFLSFFLYICCPLSKQIKDDETIIDIHDCDGARH
jgi:hypothetical protein